MDERERLRHAIEHSAHLLPAQGPIGVFIHHNTLHAFEDLPFEEAVVEGARIFDAEPFLPEDDYRRELANGRIRMEDIDAVLADVPDAPLLDGRTTRRALRRLLLQHPLRDGDAHAIDWMLHEEGLAQGADASLWTAIVERMDVASVDAFEPDPAPEHARHPDLEVNAVLVPLLSAFLDQGVAYWPMPGREQGFYLAVRMLLIEGPPSPVPLLAAARNIFVEHARRDLDAEQATIATLAAMGVRPDAWDDVLVATARKLPGWAGMMRKLEHEPELVGHDAPPCRLVDYFAVRLLLDHLVAKRSRTARPRPRQRDASMREAFALFQVAQRLGLSGSELRDLPREQLEQLRDELGAFGDVDRRRTFHLAYERKHRMDVLQAVATHRRTVEVRRDRLATPALQVVFCIDEREESIRRHLEEIDPEVETLGTGGFFGVAMSFRGIDDSHHKPLCPVVVRPEHEIHETSDDSQALTRYLDRRRLWAEIAMGTFFGSRSLVRAWIGTFGLGLLSMMPLTLRILFPRAITRLSRRFEQALFPRPQTVLALRREAEERGERGLFLGFTIREMADRVERILVDIGLTSRFSPLVVVVGHGSSSLNNPHESAHDCGACGGSRGGPNARMFALMANNADVRAQLRERGLRIPNGTLFIGGYHDTCNDAVELFDTHRVPDTHREHLRRLRAVLDEARMMSAHERCRRFESVPLTVTPEAALRHVEGRAEDLAEPRPEYGHATNAVCVFGRRALTRGLFLDRRAFLVSYDPTVDRDATVLGRLLAAMGPVGAGISLEYYFSFVDNERYGCGTKLPHNVTGLIGVMNGHMSDLRTGLPWQMVEIHEPVRLVVIVEATPETIAKVAERHPDVGRLVAHGWIQLALVHPDTGEVTEYVAGSYRPVPPTTAPLPTTPRSIDWYRGRREHLPIATIDAIRRPLERAS